MLTNSISFPQMFDVSRNKVGVLSGVTSIVNRTKLLMLTEPTELYNSLNFGVGLRRYIFTYNGDNVRAMIQDSIKEQLRLHEPCCKPDETQFHDGLLFTDNDNSNNPNQEYNKLKMTVALSTIYGTTDSINIGELSETYLYSKGNYDIGGNSL